ncbi:hypothetical protein DWZ97_02625 [Firmicutes bacterium AF36-19BH]|nr:hypothetical protein DWZ97_02625 [Firmicutes bacterium AF36-19BH]
MINLKIPVGISDFEKIRKNQYYFVDKSGLIEELLNTESNEVTLITRPRRFGKTLGMSMLASFFDIRRDSSELFQGLKISQKEELCQKWMNQYPVLFVTFKDVDGLDFQSAKEMLRIQIANRCNEYLCLLSSEKVNENDKAIFRQLADVVKGDVSDAMLKTGIALIMRMLQDYYEKPVILLLDEYDVPLAKASAHGYYAEMLEVMRAMISTALKDNPSLRFAVVTGCLRISRESIFTGTNNFVSDTIFDTRLNEYFGFLQDEVEQLLTAIGVKDKAGIVKEWYDGYHFGSYDVYCPWDVLNYGNRLQTTGSDVPVSFWKNTSDNAIIRSFVEIQSDIITDKLETLMSGGFIRQKIVEDLTYDYLHSSEENLWSVLYLTGYLTIDRKESRVLDGEYALIIPNAEIQEIFETTIQKWFQDYAASCDRRKLFTAVWNGDTEQMSVEMNRLLRQTISYYDYREDFYHAFLAGIFAGAGYMVESNKEYGEGRSDIVVKDLRDGRAAVFEVKYAKRLTDLEQECEKAVMQIDDRMYAKTLEDRYDQVSCFGIAFYKKRCLIQKK